MWCFKINSRAPEIYYTVPFFSHNADPSTLSASSPSPRHKGATGNSKRLAWSYMRADTNIIPQLLALSPSF